MTTPAWGLDEWTGPENWIETAEGREERGIWRDAQRMPLTWDGDPA